MSVFLLLAGDVSNNLIQIISYTLCKIWLLIIGTKQQGTKIVYYFPVMILGDNTSLSNTVWNLGVTPFPN